MGNPHGKGTHRLRHVPPCGLLIEGLALLGAGHELIAGGIVDARQNLVDGAQQIAALGQADAMEVSASEASKPLPSSNLI